MGRGLHATAVFRERVMEKLKECLSNAEIARSLGCSRKKVINAIRQYEETGSLENKIRKVRTRKTTSRTDALIVRTSKADPFMTAPQIKEKIERELNVVYL